MKRLILILFAFSLFVSVQGQNTSSVVWFSSVAGEAPAYTPEYQAVLDEMVVEPSPDTAAIQDVLMDSLVTFGYYARADVLWVTAQKNEQAALLDWITPTNTALAVNGPDFDPYEGYTTDGSTDYVNLQWNPTDDGSNFTQDDASISIYVRTNVQEGTVDIGAGSSTSNAATINIWTRYSDDDAYGRLNGSTAVNADNTDSRGLFSLSRPSSSHLELYKDGSSIVESTSNNSGGIDDVDLTVGAFNTGGSRQVFSSKQYAIVLIMDGITDDEAAQLNRFFETYMDAIGKGVQ